MHSKIIIIFLVIFFFTPKYSFSQSTNTVLYDSPYACPNFEFTKDLQKGDKDEEVFVLQQILNLDKRTLVAQTGVGSKGRETATFGVGTREALKRFQALFIEYIEIADGKFNQKTRSVMNSVCKGPFFTGSGGEVYDTATNTDKIAPIVGISGPTQINLSETKTFRVFIGASEAIQTPNLTGLIIDGATASDVRKTSSTTFSFLVTPNEDVADKILLQFEADSILDLAGNKNENASNEWEVLIGAETISATSTDTSVLDEILNSVTNTLTTSPDCSTVGSVSVYDYQNPCYGRAPMTDPNQNQNQPEEKKKDDSMMQMLQGLMQSLLGALGKGGGGQGNTQSMCACSKLPTVQLNPKGGSNPAGRYNMVANPGGGDYVWKGSPLPPPPVCGQAIGPKGQCINPQADMTGMPVIGSIPSSPSFIWGGN